MSISPPKEMIEHARLAAVKSPCFKSKRGCSIYTDTYLDDTDVNFMCSAFNGPPPGFGCYENEACISDCAKRCMHAEARALRNVASIRRGSLPLVMLHVKVVNDLVVPGGGPSCYYCSRDMLDSGIVHGIWLYQDLPNGPVWRYWEVLEFHKESLMAKGVLA